MALIAFTAVTFDTRITTVPVLPIPAEVRYSTAVYGRTGRIEGTALGRFFTGPSYPLFTFTNQDRISGIFYGDSKELRGFVQTGTGTGIQRTVIAISQTTYRLLGSTQSNSITGAFTLPLLLSDEGKVTVIAIPQDGDLRNIVAYRDIVPVPKL